MDCSLFFLPPVDVKITLRLLSINNTSIATASIQLNALSVTQRKHCTKMRDDVWHEYDNGLANLDGVATFDATITGYEAGANYKNGIFMTPQALGNLSLGGPSDPNFP